MDYGVDLTHPKTRELELRPFYFDVSQSSTTPVYLTKKGVLTTYAALIRENNMIKVEDFPKGIFPQYLKLPLVPYKANMAELRKREEVGRLPCTKTPYHLEECDNRFIEDFARLLQIGETATITEAGKALRLKT